MEINLTDEVNEMHGLSLDACPSYIGGVEVTETIENIIRELPETCRKANELRLQEAGLRMPFTLKGENGRIGFRSPTGPQITANR